MKQIKTVLVDSQILFTEGLSSIVTNSIPTIKIIGKCKSAAELNDLLEDTEVELIIMDLNLDDIDSIDVIRSIKKEKKEIRVLVLSSYSDWRYVKNAFVIGGADGFMNKRATVEELKEGIAQVLLGYRFLAEGLSITPTKVSRESEGTTTLYHDKFMLRQSLTKRETEILSLITQALSNKEIGEKLFISDQTVSVHRRNIMRKLGVSNTINLVKVAYEHELV